MAGNDDDVMKMTSEGTSAAAAGDMSELTESERDFRLRGCELDEDVEEEQRRLDELLTQCRDYIYSCHAQQSHAAAGSSRIITNGSLAARTPSSPPPHRDATCGVMAACWLELPVSSTRNEFPFPANNVVDTSAVTSHVNNNDDVSTAAAVTATVIAVAFYGRPME